MKTTASALAAALSGVEHFEDVVVVLTGGVLVPGKMRLVGAAKALDIEGEVVAAMDVRGLVQNVLTQGEYELERAIRMLAEAVRDAEDTLKALGSVTEWGLVSQESINAMWLRYGDMREIHDPVSIPLTAEVVAEINAALSKKNSQLLRSFGVRTLSSYLLATADRPASSARPPSSDGVSSPVS